MGAVEGTLGKSEAEQGHRPGGKSTLVPSQSRVRCVRAGSLPRTLGGLIPISNHGVRFSERAE